MSFICSRCVRRDKQITRKAVYLFAVCSPRQPNQGKCRLSVRGVLAVTSKLPKIPFICSRWACRDKQIAEKAVYLFAVRSPRQATRRKCRLSVRGGFDVTSNSPEMPFICSRWICRGKQIAGNTVYLFTVSSP